MAFLLIVIVIRDIDGVLCIDEFIELQEGVFFGFGSSFGLAEEDIVSVVAHQYPSEQGHGIAPVVLVRQERQERSGNRPQSADIERDFGLLCRLHHTSDYD